MESPNQQKAAKVFLNTTYYEKAPEAQDDILRVKNIDITELLKAHGVPVDSDHIRGATQLGVGYDGEPYAHTHWAFGEEALHFLRSDIDEVLQAAIVNNKQLSAVSSLIDEKIEDFLDRRKSKVYIDDIVKEYGA